MAATKLVRISPRQPCGDVCLFMVASGLSGTGDVTDTAMGQSAADGGLRRGGRGSVIRRSRGDDDWSPTRRPKIAPQ